MKNRLQLDSLFKNKEYQESLKVFSKLEIKELTDEELRLKAYCLQRTEAFEEAMEHWNIVIVRDSNSAEGYAERGVCKFHLQFKSALDDFDKSVDLDPKNAYRYACRGYIKTKVGDLDGAHMDYKMAVELDPENEVTANNLVLLERKMKYTKRASHLDPADPLDGIRRQMNPLETELDGQVEPLESSKSLFNELRGMLSSLSEFKRFVREAGDLFRKS